MALWAFWKLLYFVFHRFIESNKIETASKYAFRGLRDLTHLYVPTFIIYK